jgi:hypothetical protein
MTVVLVKGLSVPRRQRAGDQVKSGLPNAAQHRVDLAQSLRRGMLARPAAQAEGSARRLQPPELRSAESAGVPQEFDLPRLTIAGIPRQNELPVHATLIV